MNKLMLFLVDKLGVTRDTNRTLKQIRDFVLTVLITLLLVIDWDRTLDNLGL